MRTPKTIQFPSLEDIKDPAVKQVLENLFKVLGQNHRYYHQDLTDHDPRYTKVDPNGSLKGKRGQVIIYDTGADLIPKINTNGESEWDVIN